MKNIIFSVRVKIRQNFPVNPIPMISFWKHLKKQVCFLDIHLEPSFHVGVIIDGLITIIYDVYFAFENFNTMPFTTFLNYRRGIFIFGKCTNIVFYPQLAYMRHFERTINLRVADGISHFKYTKSCCKKFFSRNI